MKGQFVAIPADANETCDRAAIGWSRNANNDDRCGQPAVAVNPMRCNCGQCDMSIHLCAEHYAMVGDDGNLNGLWAERFQKAPQ
jgi:hypothetical protein